MKEIRRQYRFVSMLMGRPSQTVSANNVILSDRGKNCSLSFESVKQLISCGVLHEVSQLLCVTTEARSWLKRQRLELLKREGGVDRSLVNQPVKSENDTIVRLSRTSKGEKNAFLASHHVLVANRVSALIEKSQLRPSVTQNFSVLCQSGQSSASQTNDLSDMAIDCRKHLEQLVTQLPKDCAAVVVDICGFNKGLQQIEFERQWPRRSAKLVLRMGLDHAAEYWKIGAYAQGR